MSKENRELMQAIAAALDGYGYDTYLSKDGTHGFYTNGTRVVSFGGHYMLASFSGNYLPSPGCGSGWVIANNAFVPSREEAERYLRDNGLWANKNPTYMTPEQYLKTYAASGFMKFSPGEPLQESAPPREGAKARP